MINSQAIPTPKRPLTSRWAWARSAAASGQQAGLSNPAMRLAANQPLAGYEDPTDPGRGSA